MRYMFFLATVAFLSLSQLSCHPKPEVKSFEAIVEGFGADEENSSRGIPYVQRLRLSTTYQAKNLSISYDDGTYRWYKCVGDALALGGVIENRERPNRRSITVGSSERRLAAKDLRIGHRILVSYAPEANLDCARAVIINYSPPVKVLRLSISIDRPEGMDGASLEAIESIIITHLSWRLPPDIGIIKATEVPEGLTLLGDLKVAYSVYMPPTMWMNRSATDERLGIDTKLADANVSTNWTQLWFEGGKSPKGTGVYEFSYKGALGKVPMFELRQSPTKKNNA